MTEGNKVLIITYYWPPSGGSGVQRWLKFVKYLPQLGWQPFVFTPENPSFNVQDPSLFKDVPDEVETIHFPIWEPYAIVDKLSGLFSSRKKTMGINLPNPEADGLFKKVSTWIRGNFFIPDPRRFWIRPSVRFLGEFLEANNIRVIVTTGPPHSMHLIGLRLKKQYPHLRWIADFRDPWSEWGLLDSLKVSNPARSVHRRLEKRVLQTADIVTTITPFYVRHFERLGGRKVNLVTNGFDEDDFAKLVVARADKFIIRHVGIVNEKCNPRPFLLAFEELLKENPALVKDMLIEFIGQVFEPVVKFVKDSPALDAKVVFRPPVPHKQLIPMYGDSSLLLLILTGYKDAEGYMPGKLFEYLATGLPILGVGPEQGDAAQLLNETASGQMIDGARKEEIKKFLLRMFNDWKSGSMPRRAAGASKYSRLETTRQLVALFRR